ncbi:MAG TPA: glycosyltransferase family 4 protein [Roseiarcus sp.]|nr:glycosyltransferase family 4 protein [Roseiarcus sp.]
MKAYFKGTFSHLTKIAGVSLRAPTPSQVATGFLGVAEQKGHRQSNAPLRSRAPNYQRRSPRSCVIVVENLPVPFDRRVWQEAQALRRAGWRVSVICPSNASFPAPFEIIDGVAIYRHPLPPERSGTLAYFREYSAALFHQARLLIKVWREQGFSVIQACNPPDLIFLVAAPFKLIGKRFLYEQHDLSPELFVVKYGNRKLLHRALLFFERCSYAVADAVITANATFKEIAGGRAGKDPSRIETVYGVPDHRRIHRVEPEPGLRAGRQFIIGYIGVINEQDGVDHFVRAISHLVHEKGFHDFRAVIVGSGPALEGVRRLAEELGVTDFVVFTGYLSGGRLLAHISAFDIGVIPDPFNAANDVMSMNKVFEYCALGIPTACYPLRETKRLLGKAGVYAPELDPAGLAEACLSLMRDDALRNRCGEEAARLTREDFVWENEAKKYVDVYDRLLASMSTRPRAVRTSAADGTGAREYVPTPSIPLDNGRL